MRRLRASALAALAAAVMLGGLAARHAAADEFASQGQSCGSPGRPMDMSRMYAAVRQYPNGRLLFLTPAEEASLRERFRQANAAGRSPMLEMAPCFGCNQEVSACIAYDGPEQSPQRLPDRYDSSGDGGPPARGDSDACRRSDGQTAPAGSDDRPAIDRRWEKQWYPDWRRRVQQLFQRRRTLLHNLTAKGVTVDWWFAVKVAPDGTVTAAEDKDSSYQPHGGPSYRDWAFKDDTEIWRRLLVGMKAPAFPAGSMLDEVTMSVNFTNRRTGVRDTPDIPREPKRKEDATGKVIDGC